MHTGPVSGLSNFDFSHYAYALTNIPTLGRNMLNSVLVTTGTIVITTACAVLGGYALVHLALPGRALVLGLLVASHVLPNARYLVDRDIRDPACAGFDQHYRGSRSCRTLRSTSR